MFAPREFEWDEAKEANNRTKQGISFAAATRVFGDPRRIDYDASRAGDGEARRKVVGLIGNRLYTVVYTIPGGGLSSHLGATCKQLGKAAL